MSEPVAGWIEELSRTISSRLVAEERDGELCDREAVVARRRRGALRAFELSLPVAYRWSRLDHHDFRSRVSTDVIATKPPSAKSVVFLGPAGSGKTSLAVALLRASLEDLIASHSFERDDDVGSVARHCRFAHAHRLGVARLGAHGDPTEIQNAMRASVLLLDDLGCERPLPSNPIPDIIAERHAAQRATWITTERSGEEIAARYGGGVARRIFEGAAIFRLGR